MSKSTNFVFYTRIFTLRVFTNKDSVHIIIGSLEAFDRYTGTNIGKEIESSSKG